MDHLWKELGNSLMQALIPVIVVLVTAILGLITNALVAWIRKINIQTNNDRLDYYLDTAKDLTIETVLALEQAEVPMIKVSLADGKLTSEEAKKLKDKAIATILAELSPKGKQVLQEGLGDLKIWISNYIETVIFKVVKGKLPN